MRAAYTLYRDHDRAREGGNANGDWHSAPSGIIGI